MQTLPDQGSKLPSYTQSWRSIPPPDAHLTRQFLGIGGACRDYIAAKAGGVPTAAGNAGWLVSRAATMSDTARFQRLAVSMNDAGHPKTWRISAQWIHRQPQPQPAPSQPGQSPWLISPQWIEHRDIRKEYREERETEMAADLEAAKISETSAVALAQTVIKSGFILNGGGIIAIPAVVTLFNLDAERLLSLLVLTAGLFVGGICSATAASICAFFALAHKADNFYTNAVHTARVLQGKYFPPQAQEMANQAKVALRRAARLRVWWITERYVAIILCVASVALFIGGAWVGGNAILKAPHKTTTMNRPFVVP